MGLPEVFLIAFHSSSKRNSAMYTTCQANFSFFFFFKSIHWHLPTLPSQEHKWVLCSHFLSFLFFEIQPQQNQGREPPFLICGFHHARLTYCLAEIDWQRTEGAQKKKIIQNETLLFPSLPHPSISPYSYHSILITKKTVTSSGPQINIKIEEYYLMEKPISNNMVVFFHGKFTSRLVVRATAYSQINHLQ